MFTPNNEATPLGINTESKYNTNIVVNIQDEPEEIDEQPSARRLNYFSDCTFNPEALKTALLLTGAGGTVSGIVLLALKAQPYLGVGLLMGGVFLSSVSAPALTWNLFPCCDWECPCPDFPLDSTPVIAEESEEVVPMNQPYCAWW